MKRRVKQTLFISLACASLILSTFGACLCPHHEPQAEKPTLSCHSASHETETVRSDAGEPKLDSLCVCATEASPAIFNKSDRKKSEVQKETAAALELPQFGRVHSAKIISPHTIYLESESFQSSLHRISAPSRAPPRL